MKNDNYSTVLNWHYITISLIFGVVILLMVLYMPSLRSIDFNILENIRKFLPPIPQYIPGIINEIGRNYYIWPLIVSGGILTSHKYYLETFLLVFLTQASYVVVNLIKNIICRQRPCGESYPGYSFPSGHTLTATCFFGILIYLTIKHTHGFWKYFLTSVFFIFIVITGISRLWLGVHFLTDVLEGFLLGFIFVNFYIIMDKFFSRR